MMRAREIAVVGGGVAGLATAGLLARDGHRVTLLEARDDLGGRAGSWEQDGFRFDTGPSWYLMPEVFDHFYRLMGSSAEQELDLSRLDPGYRAYFQGDPEPFDLPAGSDRARAALAALDPDSAADLGRYLDTARETYRIAIDRFLFGSFQSVGPYVDRDLLRRLPRLTRLLTRSLDSHIRAHSSDSRVRRLLGYPAVFLGGSPLRVPAMYHLMSHLDVDDGVFYPQGGFARVVQSFADLATASGATLRTGADVRRILTSAGRVRGVEYVTADGRRERLGADVVVSTGDLHHTDIDLLDTADRDRDEKWWSRRTAGPGAVLAMLGVRGELPQLAHHTLLLADDWDGGFARIEGDRLPPDPSLYIGKPSASDPTVAPAGHENLFVLVPVPARPGLGRGGDPAIEEYTDRVVEQIGAWTGAGDLAERIVVRRTVGPGDFSADLRSWRGSALGPAHTLRQSALLRAPNISRRVEGLYFAGSSTIPGIGVPMCLISAELILKRLRGDKSATPLAVP